MPSIPRTSAAKYTSGLGRARVANGLTEGRNATRVLRLPGFKTRGTSPTSWCGRRKQLRRPPAGDPSPVPLFMRGFLGNWFPIFYDRFDCAHDPPLRGFTVDAVHFHE